MPPLIIALAVAIEVGAGEFEKVTSGAVVKPLPPPTRFIAVTTPPDIVAVAAAFGVFTIIESFPVVAPIVFPVTVTLFEEEAK